jgi:hypothetical protein
MSTLNDIIYEPNIIILGVFGKINKISEDVIQDTVLTPILQELTRLPDKILIPSDGNSSIYIQDWAESLHIKTQIFQADWVRNGRIAQIIRDDRMSKECTHALVFLSQKSDKMNKFAEKMAKKGKNVFTSSNHSLEMLYCDSLPPKKASMPSHKSNIEKGQTLLKFQKTV